jgi:hypothetical protein
MVRHSRRSNRSKRRASKKSRRSRRVMRGGWTQLNLGGAPVGQNTMMFSSSQNLAQGKDYQQLHVGQHGGGTMYQGAPVGTTGVLDSNLHTAARIGPTMAAYGEIRGMRDQAGGGRRKRRGSRRSRRSRRRNMYGGASVSPADYGSRGTLLPPAMERIALNSQNPEMRLAQDPNYYAPKLA